MGECAEAGIHYKVSFEDYKGWDAMNGSTLLWGNVTASHLQSAILGHMNTDTRDRKFGRACHCRILEPQRYREEYLIAEPCCAELSSGKRKGSQCGKRGAHLLNGEWYCGTHKPPDSVEPEDFIDQDESDAIERIAQKLFTHPAAHLVRRKGGFETSIVWEMQGIRFKGRLDKYSPQVTSGKYRSAIITDVKKCQVGKASWDIFGTQAAKLGYVAKAALYCDGIKSITGETPVFMWLVIEDKHPHEIAVYQAMEWQLDIGRQEYQAALEIYKRSMDTDHWPGYSSDVEKLHLPDWYEKRWNTVIYE